MKNGYRCCSVDLGHITNMKYHQLSNFITNLNVPAGKIWHYLRLMLVDKLERHYYDETKT